MTAPAAAPETQAITGRSLATRAKLIRTAERLFAERGVDSVSLNEISRAAEQRHSNVCQYHFGDRDGLIQAIIDKHVPGIVAAREVMLDALAAETRDGPEAMVRAFVRPVAAKLSDPDGGVAFIRFSAQMIAANVLRLDGQGPYRFTVPGIDELNRRLIHAVRGQNLSEAARRDRLTMASIMLFQGLAVYSTLREARGGEGAGSDRDRDRFVADLERMIVGALTAPVSSEGAP
jgi:AcrR family transcriptional regulator